MKRLENPRTLIIVTGGPGTGKSYTTRKIRESIEGLTILSYDEIKEKNWDRFGFDNSQQKEQVNMFSLEEFYLCVKKAMWKEETILIEYPFYQRHKPRLSELMEEYAYNVVTVYLYGDWKTVYERGVNRDNDGTRHPGHLTKSYHVETYQGSKDFVPDAMLNFDEFCAQMKRKNYDIRLGHCISVDITDYTRIDYDQMMRQIFEFSKK